MNHSLTRLALLSMAALGTLAAAQSPSNDPASAPPVQTRRSVDPQKQLNHLAKKLTLSADQQTQMLPILTDRQQQFAAIQNDSTLDQKQRHERMQAVRADSNSKLRGILTDSQRATYDEMQKQAHDRSHGRRQSAAA